MNPPNYEKAATRFPNTAAPSSSSTETIRYNLFKTMGRWTIIVLLLVGIAYTILTARTEQTPQSALDTGGLGPFMAIKGSTVAVTAIHDDRQEILVSTDSGATFTSTGDEWPMKDSLVALEIAPDSQTVFAMEKEGRLHIKKKDTAHFSNVVFQEFGPLHAVKDICFISGTDYFCIYGNLPFILRASWKEPFHYTSFPVDQGMSVNGLVASAPNGVAALLSPFQGFASLYTGPALNSLELLQYAYRSIPAAVNQSNSINLKSSYDSLSSAYPESFRNYYSIGYEETKQVFFATYYYRATLAPFYFSSAGYFHGPTQWFSPVFSNSRLLLDTSAFPVYYGNGPFIQQGSILDSIPTGGNIRSIALSGNRPSWALLSNDKKNYLFHKQNGIWTLDPVLFSQEPFTMARDVLIAIAIVLTLFLAVLFEQTRRLQRRISKALDSTVNELLTKSERPLNLNDADLLGFTDIEDAITRIILNQKVELPMTIVISGTWGSGKSSMMNRIRERLRARPVRRRFMTTWFNAWHLQGENSLLNSFLLNIIACYEKYYAWFSPFRIRIFAARYARLPVWKKFGVGFAVALLAPFCILLILKVLSITHLRRWEWVDEWCNIISTIFFSSQGLNTGFLNPIGAGLLIVVSILFINRQFIPAGLSAFFELLPRNNFQLDVEKIDIGSREKFRQQYWEIMNAARKGTRMVVFIDDLDRVGGDKILELLEGINFISDTASRPPESESIEPNTVFVLGMYTQEVARLVGTQLKKVNQSQLSEEMQGSLYIEKMVQLIVPVPFDSDNAAQLKKLYEND